MSTPSSSSAEDLLAQIERMIILLESDGESHWRLHLAETASRIRQGDIRGLRSFLGAFGTAGSFNECSVATGRWIGKIHEWLPGEEAKYREFEELKNTTFVLARQLLRASDKPSMMSIAGCVRGIPKRTKVLLSIALSLSVLAVVARYIGIP